MTNFKGTKGPWLIESSNYSYSGVTYNFTGNTGEKVITDSSPIKFGEPTIFSVLSRESFGHQGNFTDRENLNGYYTSSDINHKANALLISKAPEMLKEIEEILIDIKILRNQILFEINAGNTRFEGMENIMSNWIERKENIIKSATEL